MPGVYRLCPYEYVHVEDSNTCQILTLEGPLTFTLYDHYRVLHDTPQKCIIVPPDHYVAIHNPVVREGGELDMSNEADVCAVGYTLVSNNPLCLRRPRTWRCMMGQVEYRFAQAPFPLFPGEVADNPTPILLLAYNEALVLEATENYTYTAPQDGAAHTRVATEQFLFTGPGRYAPNPRDRILRTINAVRVRENTALLLRADITFVDTASGEAVVRTAGERWIMREHGDCFIHPCATVERVLHATVLTPTTAVHVRALEKLPVGDSVFALPRAVGDEWLVTQADLPTGAFIPSLVEEVIRTLSVTSVGSRQYCVLENYLELTASTTEGKTQHWGKAIIREGPCTFFLHPGERLVGGRVRDAYVLNESEALLVKALKPCTDVAGVSRDVAERWLVAGPRCFVPPLSIRVLERRRRLLLNQNEGVYVRNVCTGTIRSVHGAPFQLSEDEELWGKPVRPRVRLLLDAPRLSLRVSETPEIVSAFMAETNALRGVEGGAGLFVSSGDKHNGSEEQQRCSGVDCDEVRLQPEDISRYSVLSVNVEHNSLLRLCDLSTGVSRVVAGPAAVTLGPHEQFIPSVLSGGRPKQPNQIHCLTMYLGPDYMADVIEVETLDHARLTLQLAYNWEFDTSDMQRVAEIAFTIPDFIGEACKTLASRVRSAIANETFEDFHRNSSTLIKQAVFSEGVDGSTEVRGSALYFHANGMLVTNVDVQSVEPVDVKTRQALTKSVQLAVEIITKSQENEATHNATLLEQEANGAIDLQVMKDRSSAEEARAELLDVIVRNATIEQCGASQAQALAESEARLVEAQADLDTTERRCEAHEVGVESELEILKLRMNMDLNHRKAMNNLAVDKAKKLADLEARKYEKIMAALGKETVVALAQAGPELQAKLLEGLGLQGFLVTDGTAPINLVNVAQQLTQTS